MKTPKYHIIISIIIGLVLILPLVQNQLHLVKIKPLLGEFDKHQQPQFNITNWMNHSYQDSIELYNQQNFGFAPLLTRLHNQYIYEVFSITRTPSVIIGKKNQIYDYGHIQSYLGYNYLGIEKINEKVNKIEAINNELKKFNTEIILVIAPSKPGFQPEFLPEKYSTPLADNNYSGYISRLKSSSIKYVDFSDVFNKWKLNSPYPLYPQCGVHWSEYGATLAADSMLKYIYTSLETTGPKIIIDSVVLSDSLSKSDYDMGSILNLLQPIQPYPMGYPKLHIENPDEKKLNILTIGDSYYWIWYNSVGFGSHFFKKNIFLEYYQVAHSIQWGAKSKYSINIMEESVQSNLIMIVCSESNLYRLGYGYIEEAYEAIPELNKLYINKIDGHKKNIKNDDNWYELIKRKAENKNISIDSMLTLDAIYLMENEKKN